MPGDSVVKDQNVTTRRKRDSNDDEDSTRYQLELFDGQRKRLGNEIVDRIRFVRQHISEKVDYLYIKDEIENLSKAFAEVIMVYEKILPLVANTTEYENWFSNLDTEVFLTKSSGLRYISEFEKKICRSSSSKSSVSSKRSRSSKSSKSSSISLMEHEAELACLEVELEFASKKGLSEEESFDRGKSS